MKKQLFLITTFCTLFSISLVIGLKVYNNNLNQRKNHFSRIFPSHFVGGFKSEDIRYNSYYIAGLSSEKNFLGNSTAPTHILVADYSLRELRSEELQMPGNYRIAQGAAAKVAIEFPDIYLSERLSSTILHGSMPSLQLAEIYHPDSIRFDKFQPISSETFALRLFDTLLRQNTIAIKKKKNYNC